MSSLPSSTGNANQRDLPWSPSEKAIARKAFDAALSRELHELIQEAKQMASQIRHSSDLWDLEHYLIYELEEFFRNHSSLPFPGDRFRTLASAVLYFCIPLSVAPWLANNLRFTH